jgi:hypothetical protein
MPRLKCHPDTPPLLATQPQCKAWPDDCQRVDRGDGQVGAVLHIPCATDDWLVSATTNQGGLATAASPKLPGIAYSLQPWSMIGTGVPAPVGAGTV